MRRSSLERPSAHSRHPSEQEVVLPSVEREQVDLTSPRRADETQQRLPGHNRSSGGHAQTHSPRRRVFQPLHESKPISAEQSHKRMRPVHGSPEPNRYTHQDGVSPRISHHTVDLSREPPPPQFVDLTTSPYRPLANRVHVSDHMHGFEQNGHLYVPASARPPPPREASNAYYRLPANATPHAYMPEARVYPSQAPPPGHAFPRRHVQHPPYTEDERARYLRSGVKYGG